MKKAIETLKNIWSIEDLRKRILITILFVAIYRFGSNVVLPGIDPGMLKSMHEQTSSGLLALLDMFSGVPSLMHLFLHWELCLYICIYCYTIT